MSWLESFKTVSKKKQIRRGYVHLPGNTTSCSSGLFAGLPLGHPLRPDLDPRLAERLDHVKGVHPEEAGDFARVGVRPRVLALRLVVPPLRLELHSTAGHYSGCQHVAVVFLLLPKAEHVEGVLSVLQLLVVVNRVN